MTTQRFIFLTIGAALLWCYVMATEVADRWRNVIQSYHEVNRKEDGFLRPEKLAEEKWRLLRSRQSLFSSLSKEGGDYEQNQTGVIEYLNHCAREAHVQFASLIPVESSSNDLVKEIGFKVTCAAGYHKIGRFINLVETGSLLVQIRKVEVSKVPNDPNLSGIIEGSAYILPKK